MKNGMAKWLGEIALAIISAWLGLSAFAYAYAGINSLSWNPGMYQMHPLVWAGVLIVGIIASYVSYVALKSAKRGGEWKWQ